MSYYLARREKEIWTLGTRFSHINDALAAYEAAAHLRGARNVKLLMERGVATEMTATLLYPLENEKGQVDSRG